MLKMMSEFDVLFTFKRRLSSIPPDLRLEWRLPLLLLILKKCCRQHRASITKLHVMNWSIRSRDSKNKFIAIINEQINPGDVLIRYEPALNKVIDLAIGEKLIEIVSGNRVQLSSNGLALANEIDEQKCLLEEKDFLNIVEKSVTENRLKKIIEAVVSV